MQYRFFSKEFYPFMGNTVVCVLLEWFSDSVRFVNYRSLGKARCLKNFVCSLLG